MERMSIVIPVYNRAQVVQRTLASVLAQTFRPVQVVLVDNCSTDSTLHVLNDFKASYSTCDFEVIVTQEEQHTAGAARNRGFTEAGGDWVMFFDSDDEMHPTLVERYMSKLKGNDIVAVKARLHKADGSYSNLAFATRDILANQIIHSILGTQRYCVRSKFVAQADEVDPADRDYAASMTYLADCFSKGRGVEKNFDLALSAADKAYAAADKLTPYELMNLAAFYDSVRPNAVSAAFDAAADAAASAGAPDGAPAVSAAVESARKVDAAKAADLYTRAASGIKALADAGNLHAVKYLGDLYFYGMGGYKQDYAKALETYMTAAEQGDADAQAQIGRIYMDGLGVEQDAEKAMDWNMRAAEQGNAQGQEQIGKMYYLGIGMTKSTEEASRWFERARDSGSQWAAAMLEQPDVSVAADYHSAHA